MKETLSGEIDRNMVSATESTVQGKPIREHSGADMLNYGMINLYIGIYD